MDHSQVIRLRGSILNIIVCICAVRFLLAFLPIATYNAEILVRLGGVKTDGTVVLLVVYRHRYFLVEFIEIFIVNLGDIIRSQEPRHLYLTLALGRQCGRCYDRLQHGTSRRHGDSIGSLNRQRSRFTAVTVAVYIPFERQFPTQYAIRHIPSDGDIVGLVAVLLHTTGLGIVFAHRDVLLRIAKRHLEATVGLGRERHRTGLGITVDILSTLPTEELNLALSLP